MKSLMQGVDCAGTSQYLGAPFPQEADEDPGKAPGAFRPPVLLLSASGAQPAANRRRSATG